jgi:hypothetical protein
MALLNNETIVPQIRRSQTRVYERIEAGAPNDNFSLTPILQRKSVTNRFEDVSDKEKRECYRVREKSEASGSILEQPRTSEITWLTPTEKAAIEERDRKRLEIQDLELLQTPEKTVKKEGCPRSNAKC